MIGGSRWLTLICMTRLKNYMLQPDVDFKETLGHETR